LSADEIQKLTEQRQFDMDVIADAEGILNASSLQERVEIYCRHTVDQAQALIGPAQPPRNGGEEQLQNFGYRANIDQCKALVLTGSTRMPDLLWFREKANKAQQDLRDIDEKLASKAPASDPKCLSYAPALVTLTGALTEKSDEPETYWVLNLGQPICTTGGEHSSNVAERNVSSLQLLFTNDEVYQRYRFLLNTTVKVTGSLASGTTAQHYTQVVLQVVPPEGSAPLESVGGH
jgi:hypothetical protein